MKFLHAMIRVKDIDKSLDFYTKLLGLNLVRTIKLDDCILYFLSDEDGQTQIELTANFENPENGYENNGSEATNQSFKNHFKIDAECEKNAFGHFAFGVDSMAEFDKKLRSIGYEYLYEPYYMEEAGSTIAFIKDPDGNEIELIQ